MHAMRAHTSTWLAGSDGRFGRGTRATARYPETDMTHPVIPWLPNNEKVLAHILELTSLTRHDAIAAESVACYARTAAWMLEHTPKAELDAHKHPRRMLAAVYTNLHLYKLLAPAEDHDVA